MYTITIEREDGEQLKLTGDGSPYHVTYTGLGPVDADIITSSLGMVDGERYSGARVRKRNVVLMIYIKADIEENRLRLYQYLAPKSKIKLYYTNGAREVCAEGYVESNTPNQFKAPCYNQVSIICPKSYLSAISTIVQEISAINDLFEFPFSIEAEGVEMSSIDSREYVNVRNAGDVPTGAIIRVFAQTAVTGANIYNAMSNEYIKVEGTLEAGDLLAINTNAGSKSITITHSTGETVKALHRLADGSTWLQFAVGDNYIAYTADSGKAAMTVSIEHSDLFVGV